MRTWARDRNRADEHRVCIENAGDRPTCDVLMPRLVATLPDNYFYAGCYGQNRLDRGRVWEALPYLKRAAARANGP